MRKREFEPFPDDGDEKRERFLAELADCARELQRAERALLVACPNLRAIGADLADVSRRIGYASEDLGYRHEAQEAEKEEVPSPW